MNQRQYGLMNRETKKVSHVSRSEGLVRGTLNRMPPLRYVMVTRYNENGPWEPM